MTGELVFLNLGTRAAIPNVPGLAAERPLTHLEALELDRVPEHLVMLGGGYVGVEMGHAMRRFGSRVVEKGPLSARTPMSRNQFFKSSKTMGFRFAVRRRAEVSSS